MSSTNNILRTKHKLQLSQANAFIKCRTFLKFGKAGCALLNHCSAILSVNINRT